MKILKKGKLPKPPPLTLYRGKCTTCGCEIEVTEHEVWEGLGESYLNKSVKCPTQGCSQWTTVTHYVTRG